MLYNNNNNNNIYNNNFSIIYYNILFFNYAKNFLKYSWNLFLMFNSIGEFCFIISIWRDFFDLENRKKFAHMIRLVNNNIYRISCY